MSNNTKTDAQTKYVWVKNYVRSWIEKIVVQQEKFYLKKKQHEKQSRHMRTEK